MCDSLELLLLAILAPAIHCLWHLSSWEEAFITTVSVHNIALGIYIMMYFVHGLEDSYYSVKQR